MLLAAVSLQEPIYRFDVDVHTVYVDVFVTRNGAPVTDLDPGRRFSWKSGSAIAWCVATHWVEAARAGSRASLSLHFGGPLGGIIGWLLRNLNNRYLAMEAAGLKRRSEGLAQEGDSG